MNVKTLKKKQVSAKIWVISEEKITKSVETGPSLSSFQVTFTKLSSNKGRTIRNITGKFHSGLECSSCFMVKL